MVAKYTFLVQPPETEMASTSTLPLIFDLTPWIEEGDIPANATAVLYLIPQNTVAPVGLLQSVGIQGNTIIVVVGGLQAGQEYLLLASADLAPSKRPTAGLRIKCPI